MSFVKASSSYTNHRIFHGFDSQLESNNVTPPKPGHDSCKEVNQAKLNLNIEKPLGEVARGSAPISHYLNLYGFTLTPDTDQSINLESNTSLLTPGSELARLVRRLKEPDDKLRLSDSR